MNDELCILFWNIMMTVLPILKQFGQSERIKRIKQAILDLQGEKQFDIIVFAELIPKYYIDFMKKEMSEIGFIYSSKELQESIGLTGGVVIFSRYPIISQKNQTFGDACLGADCFASKGVAYVKIEKNKKIYNIFATHMQAWSDISAQIIKDQQVQIAKTFIEEQNISINEPVIFCGDFNHDYYTEFDQFRHLLYQLHLEDNNIHPQESHLFTLDAENNVMYGIDDIDSYKSEKWPNGCADIYFSTLKCVCCPPVWNDYFTFSKKHQKPIDNWMKSIVYKTKEPFDMILKPGLKIKSQDISDHFPLIGYFQFDNKIEKTMARTTTTVKNKNKISTNTHKVGVFLIILFTVIILFIAFILLLVFYIRRKYKKKNQVLENI